MKNFPINFNFFKNFSLFHIFALGKGYMIDSQKDKQEKKRKIKR